MKTYGVSDYNVQKEWYKHPKLKFYQYFNGKSLRFFKYDMINIWIKYFINNNNNNSLNENDINLLNIYDNILDLKKCDQIYTKWYKAITRSIDITNNNDKNK